MEYTIIEVPDMNDSVSRVVLSGTPYFISSVQKFSLRKSRTLRDSMDCSMPGYPVHCQPSELTQTHVNDKFILIKILPN